MQEQDWSFLLVQVLCFLHVRPVCPLCATDCDRLPAAHFGDLSDLRWIVPLTAVAITVTWQLLP